METLHAVLLEDLRTFTAALWVAKDIAHLDAIVSSHFNPNQGCGKGLDGQGRFHTHDSLVLLTLIFVWQ